MEKGKKRTPAMELVAGLRAGWNLGNTLDAMKRDAAPGEWASPAETETAWGNPRATRGLIRAVRNAGFDAIRLPVTWTQHMSKDGEVDPAWMERVAEVTDWILEAGMVCLLNVHHDAGAHGWLQGTEACHAACGKRFETLWQQIAARFADTGERLVFEAFNEMLDGKEHWTQTEDPEAYDAHNRWHQRFVDTVRAAGGWNKTRILSLQTYSGGNTAKTLGAFRKPEDSEEGRIILQTHNYDPMGFCWRKAEGQEMRNTWGTEADEREQETLFADLSAFALKHNAPLMIGEFGSENKGNPEARAAHAGAFMRRAREKGIVCFWWDCGAFALFDRRKEQISQREIVKALCE